MYLVLCLHPKISNTCEFQDDPIIRRYDSLVDYLLLYFNRCHTCGCSIFVLSSMPYTLLRLYCGSREIKSSNAAECYTGWHKINRDHLLKLYMGCLLTIKINYNGIVVSVCVFSMVKPVQCLLNMDGKGTLSISDCMP